MEIQLRKLICFIILLAANQILAAEPLLLITQAHAHNDYVHARPLLDALDHGFCSVEADIFLTNGMLLVAHKLAETKPERTLQALYLDPLRERVKENGGSVYPNGPEFTLLIELKQPWEEEYSALHDVLTNYADVLVSYHNVSVNSATDQPWAAFANEIKVTNAILVVVTGHRDPAMFAGETIRYAALDGQLSDLNKNPPAILVPWISENWKANFYWKGAGAIPDTELRKLQAMVKRTHQQGRRLRFWNAPDQPNFWQVMHVAGVDLINTDNLAGVANFFGRAN